MEAVDSALAENIRFVPPNHYWWLLVLGLIFAAYDAFGIGANDVANSFANAVAARTITLLQATCIAAVMEFVGAVALGKSVTKTIAGSVLSSATFENQVDTLMLAMVCALIGSSLWVNSATLYGMPVSTTHSIVGAVVGVGIAMGGSDAIQWGEWDSGVIGIVVGWGIAPVLAGLAAAAIYLPTKFIVLSPRVFGGDTYKKALRAMPIYMFGTLVIIMWFMFYKGFGKLSSKITDRFSKGAMLGLACCAGALAAVFTQLVVVPLMRRRYDHMEDTEFAAPVRNGSSGTAADGTPGAVTPGDASLKANNGIPLHDIPPTQEVGVDGANLQAPASVAIDAERLESQRAAPAASPLTTLGAPGVGADKAAGYATSTSSMSNASESRHAQFIRGASFKSKELYARTVGRDVVSVDADNKHLVGVHARATRYSVRTEGVFSWVQVVTCSFASLAHGANDVANAVGPLSAIYYFWENGGTSVPSSVTVKTWVLAYGGFFIVLGLALRGWYIMAALGNNMTPISPSRGFAMELGAVLAVLIATARGLPVSTTQCITGAVIAVGLCNGDVGAVNWRMVSWTLFGWLITVPVAGVVAGLIFSVVAFSPKALDCNDSAFFNGQMFPTCTPRIYGNLYTDMYLNATTLG
eukprot:jgi/Mesvir1/28054/Mv04654-RA.1